METAMRKIMSISVAVMVALFAIGTLATWATATATTNSPEQIGNSGYQINVMELMSNSPDLPAQQYEAF
jgi:hypothetical protein